MKIAFILNQFPVLSETFVLNQITGLLDRGHEVNIFANSESNEPKTHPDIEKYDLISKTSYIRIPGNKFRRVFKAVGLFFACFFKTPVLLIRSINIFRHGVNGASVRLWYWAMSFVGREPFDIIHCHFGPNGILGAGIKTLGIQGRLVVAFHGYDMTTFIARNGSGVYEKLFETADLLLPISERWRSRLIEMGADPSKTIVHHMGLNLRSFRFKDHSARKDPTVKLLTVGRLVEKKGIEYGIRAVAKIKKRNPGLLLKYEIIGDGPLREVLQDLISDFKLNNIVNLLGAKTSEKVQCFLAKTDLFLLPSVTAKDGDQEGLPVSLMEAMAFAIPVISTLHSGIPELVQDKRTGFLVPEQDADALAERLEYLIANPGTWLEMGRNGRRFVEENYDIEKLNDRLVEIFRGLMHEDLPNGSVRKE